MFVSYIKPVNQVTFLCNLITTSVVTDCSYDQFFGRKLFLQILQELEPAQILCHTVVLPTRAVYCDTRSSYDELLRKAKLTTLGCCRSQDIAIIMYKAKYNICPPYIKDIFKLDKPRYGLRNSSDFFIP